MSKNKTMKQPKTNMKPTESSGSVPEFIQKLFRMLENKAFKDTFCWGQDGTTFIVKDTNEFSKTILPKHFKHCNFASFVRQLNKYDFHKVRNAEDGQKQTYGDQSWEFVHPKFIRDRKDLLEDIRRKSPGTKQKKEETTATAATATDASTKSTDTISQSSVNEMRRIATNLQLQIDQLKKSRMELENNIDALKQTDKRIVDEMTSFNKSLNDKDAIVKEFLNVVSMNTKDNQDQREIQELLESYSQLSQKNNETISTISQQLQSGELGAINTEPSWESTSIKAEPIDTHMSDDPTNIAIPKIIHRLKAEDMPMTADSASETASAAAAAASMNAGSLIGSPLKTADGLAFVTLGRLSSNMSVRDNKPAIEIMAADQTPTLAASLQRPQSGIKRKSSQTNWTVPPRILLVDDDSVYRDLSGKLLQVIGCTIDLAKDGVEALKKMGLEKYDLILMDIMMPKMDGISATRSIRQYDALTPIISMTSNFTDSDIMQYIGSGMTDILPKPFSKRTLYQMLEKYCAHLKTIQRVQGHDSTTTSIPRSLGDIELLPITVGESNSSSTPTNEAGPASSTSMYRPIEAPIPATSASSMPPVSTTSAPSSSAFPLAPYPYPVTMNSVSADANNASFTNATNGDIPNVTFWPQQQTQQHDPPPAIVPSSEGKFMWAVPGSNAQPTPFDPMGIINDANKRQRMNPPPPQEQ